MTIPVRLVPIAILALSFARSEARAADTLAPSDRSLAAAAHGLTTGVLNTGVLNTGVLTTSVLNTSVLTTSVLATGALATGALPGESLPAAFVPESLGPEAPEPPRGAVLPAYRSVEQSAALVSAEARDQARNHAWRNRWLMSLAPLAASQSLDAASSWGLRELNPLLAGPDGRFGMQAMSIKFGAIGGLTAAEYLLVRRFAASARFFAVVNYTTAGITSGLAVHNYRLPGR